MGEASAGGHDTRDERSLVGEVLFEKLRVDSELGRGGMGVVYRVTHLGTKHKRALKVLHPEITADEDALVRFQREATVSGLVRSPFIVETLDTGKLPDGSLYVLMELLDGQPLADLVGQKPMPLARIARLLRQACRALALAHEQGIVHRDIKPDNLFVTKDEDGEERVKILDFGIARFRGAITNEGEPLGDVTREHAVLGTPLYMAPEQIGTASQADGRADVYALGVVLYEALSGRKPYDASTFAELVVRIYEGTSTPLERTAPGLTPLAYDVVRRAMSRRPEDRYASARELEAALAALEMPIDLLVEPVTERAPMAMAETLSSNIPPPARVPDFGEAESSAAFGSAEFGIPRTVASVMPPESKPPSATVSSRAPSWTWPAGIAAAVTVAVVGYAMFGAGGTATTAAPVYGDSWPPTAPDAGIVAAVVEPDVVTPPVPPEPTTAETTPEEVPGTRPPRHPPGERPRGASSSGLAGPDEVYGGSH